MKKNVLIVSIIWIVLVGSSLAINVIRDKDEQRTVALQTARSFFDQVLMTRAWNAGHGGVFVPVTNETQPNPYLKDADRDIKINESLVLTKINPAYMTRQIAEIASDSKGVKFHITSLNPIRPANKATSLEERALRAFEKGTPEVSEFVRIGDKRHFFYMAPLKVETSCLTCHAEQGYVEDEVRGGISITLPDIPELSLPAILTGHAIIGIFGLVGIIVFGTKLANAYSEIRHQAVNDALTGIANRRGFVDRIQTEFDRSLRGDNPLSLIIGDIDDFKNYNDQYGHNGGDACLRGVAKAIKSSLQRPADICARIGGEEFVVVLPDTDMDGARFIAEMIRQAVSKIRIHEKSSGHPETTISLGVATRDDDSNTTHSYEELIKLADQALYQAKKKGKNRVEVFDPETDYNTSS